MRSGPLISLRLVSAGERRRPASFRFNAPADCRDAIMRAAGVERGKLTPARIGDRVRNPRVAIGRREPDGSQSSPERRQKASDPAHSRHAGADTVIECATIWSSNADGTSTNVHVQDPSPARAGRGAARQQRNAQRPMRFGRRRSQEERRFRSEADGREGPEPVVRPGLAVRRFLQGVDGSAIDIGLAGFAQSTVADRNPKALQQRLERCRPQSIADVWMTSVAKTAAPFDRWHSITEF